MQYRTTHPLHLNARSKGHHLITREHKLTPKVRAKLRPPGHPPTNLALLPRTRLDESGVNVHMLNSRITLYKGLHVFTPGDNTAQFLLQLYFVYFDIDFSHAYFLLSSSLSQTSIVLRSSRIRHDGDTGADVQKGPVSRILFRLRPCVNLFYCLLLTTSPGFPYNRGGGWHLGMWPRQNFARTWTPGAFLPRALFRPVFIKTEYLRECSASRVWPYRHQLQIMSLVKCWVCPAPMFCCLTFRYIG